MALTLLDESEPNKMHDGSPTGDVGPKARECFRDSSAPSERCTSVADYGPSHNVLPFSAPQSFLVGAFFSIYANERQFAPRFNRKIPDESQPMAQKVPVKAALLDILA
jgi:hypothetical protein